MIEDGIGDLHEKFEQLKAKLEKEGLFDISHKKQIPLYPKVVGVLTSQTGAVIRDIINVSTRRNPNVYIRLLPVPVQGPGAAEQIAEKIKIMNDKKLADVIIIGRGGGSLEDLWPFNEEIVARAIYDSELPIISAVGHETDFTIADFVADLRAPTPSAAAELAVPDVYELKQKMNQYQNRYRMALKKKIEFMRLRYEKCMKSRAFTDPTRKIKDEYVVVDAYIKRLEMKIRNIQKEKINQYIALTTKLDTMSPLKTLTRGYSLVEKDNQIIKSVKQLKSEDEVKIRFFDGEKMAKILEQK